MIQASKGLLYVGTSTSLLIDTPQCSWRLRPTGKSATTETPISAECAAGPMPDRMRIAGDWIAPPETIVSRARISIVLTPRKMRTPIACLFSIITRSAIGEALILETEIPDTAPYWNVQLNDEVWNTLDYVWRQSHLNSHQAHLDSDGKFRAVISVDDPGVLNWLDTVGRLQGTMVGHWYKCSSHPVPTLKKVKLAEVRDHLPSNTPVIDAQERDARIRARARSLQMRTKW